MNKAAQLAAALEKARVEEGLKLIEGQTHTSLYFDVIDDVMCMMHSDGSVNLIAQMGDGAMTVEVMSARSILRVLKHYRPFKDVFEAQVQ